MVPPAGDNPTLGAVKPILLVLLLVAVTSTNCLQVTSDFALGNWEAIATIIPTTNTAAYVEQSAITNRQRSYRWLRAQ